MHENAKNDVGLELLNLFDQLQVEIGEVVIALAIEGIEQFHRVTQRRQRRQKIRMLVSLAPCRVAIRMPAKYAKDFQATARSDRLTAHT